MALEGAGVAMGQRALVAADVKAGRLVEPFAQRVNSGDAFYLMYPNRLAQDAFVLRFRDWLLDEARESAQIGSISAQKSR
jgi:LysR family glycine cleavage system transcriptional activator